MLHSFRWLRRCLGWLGLGTGLAGGAAHGQDVAQLPKQPPITLTGSFDLRAITYSYTGELVPRRAPFSYVLAGSPTLGIYGVAVPLSFVVSDQQRDIRQSFNEFGLSPTYKGLVTLHLGYRNLYWSPFTLAGHTILGVGVETNFRQIRLGFIKGRFNRATGLDQTLGTTQPYSFDRRGWALKVGAGNDTTFFDMSLLVAHDDSSSIGPAEQRAAGYAGQLTPPAENAVIGFSTRQGLGSKRYWYLTADGGGSVYTPYPSSRLQLDNSDASSYAHDLFGHFIHVNGSSEFSSAWQAAVGFLKKGQGFKIGYRRVSPGYQSMGAYFFQDDVANLTVSPTFALFRQRLRLNGSFGLQQDNLRNQKQLTSKRVIASANASLELGPYLGIDASYFNFTTDQQPARAVLVADSFRLAQSTQSISVSPRFLYAGKTLTHTVLLSLDRSTLRAIGTNPYDQRDEFTSVNAFASYQLGLLRAHLTLGATYSYTQLALVTGQDQNQGLLLTASEGIGRRQALRLTVRASSLSSSRQGQPGHIRLGGVRGTLRLGRHGSFRADVAYTSYDPAAPTLSQPRYTETRGEFGYGFSF